MSMVATWARAASALGLRCSFPVPESSLQCRGSDSVLARQCWGSGFAIARPRRECDSVNPSQSADRRGNPTLWHPLPVFAGTPFYPSAHSSDKSFQ